MFLYNIKTSYLIICKKSVKRNILNKPDDDQTPINLLAFLSTCVQHLGL